MKIIQEIEKDQGNEIVTIDAHMKAGGDQGAIANKEKEIIKDIVLHMKKKKHIHQN